MSLEYEKKQIGQAATGSCGLKLPCDFRCGPLIMMFRNLHRKLEAKFSLTIQSKGRPCLFTLSLSFLRKMAIMHIYSRSLKLGF